MTESNAIEPTTVSDMRPCILSAPGAPPAPAPAGAWSIAFWDGGTARAKRLRARAAGPDFHAIGDYGFLSDCHTGALVASDGTVEWLCLPRFDSPSVFAALLDRGAGAFRLGPRGLRAPVARRYVPGTNVLETSWMTDTGWFVVRDALALAPPGTRTARDTHARELGPHDAEHLLIRTVECVHGRVEVETVCEPAFDYATEEARWKLVDRDGLTADASGGGETLRLLGDIPLEIDGSVAHGARVLEAGDRCFSCLSWREELSGPKDAADAVARLDCTVQLWRRWLEAGTFPDHPWRWTLQRSALVLKGLTYEPTGAMVAALTTSLPETPGGERNWDYRYTWIRDATFTLWSLHVIGFDQEAREFMEFVCDLFHGRGPEAQIMFGIGGETELTERTLDHLSGYVGSRPVRIGNAAYDQRQNDVYGALLDSIYIHSKTREGVPEADGADRLRAGGGGRLRLAPARPGDLGGARRAQALRLLEADVLGGARPRRAARQGPWPQRARGELGAGGERGAGRDPGAGGESSGASSASTTRPMRSTPRCC